MMEAMIPHYTSLQEAISALFGPGLAVVRTQSVSGGDINDARRLTLSDGTALFLKSNRPENLPFFTTEAQGLSAIRSTGTIGTPRILCTGRDDHCSFLLMEHLSSGRPVPHHWEVFGRQLSALHAAPTAALTPGGVYGFAHDNYIGAGVQVNTPGPRWVPFFRDCRLLPQFRRAAPYFDAADRARITRLLDYLEDWLPEPDHPSLLHGDLWSGNKLTGPDGKLWLIDPAAYVGHAEADLAMTELFGGFSPAFYAAYQEAAPLQPGYPRRRALYNLYHLLNHLNLFGGGYLSSVRQILRTYAP